MAVARIQTSKSRKFLKSSINIWFFIVVLGQILFALYIFGLYGVSGLAGDYERWADNSITGYEEEDSLGNIFFGVHMLFAFIITVGGPLQLMSKVREKFPKFHRINGRIYILSAFLISLAGFYLTWIRGSANGLLGSIFVSINGLIILVCAFYTIKKAISRQLQDHRKWALRLFLAMSGVWFFRVFIMLWFIIFQGPVGIDEETFQGPAINLLNVLSFILPVFFLEFYFKAKASKNERSRWLMSGFMFLLSLCIFAGTIAATMGMWLPAL